MLEKINVETILRKALKNGGDFADLYFENSETTQVLAENRKIEKAYGGIDRGMGIRVLHDDKTAYGYTSLCTQKNLEELAQTVASAVKYGSKHDPIPLHNRSTETYYEIKKAPASFKLSEKVDLVKRAQQEPWSADQRIRQVKVVYGDLNKSIQIANSLGEFIEDERIYTLLYVQAVAAEGDLLQTGYHPVGGLAGLEILDHESPELIAQKASQQAIMMLGARKAPSGTMPVVISCEAGGTMIHEAVGHGLEADLACERLSVYQGKIGEHVASAKITVIDDSTLPQKRGSFAFDDEGSPSQRSLLIENGILKNYMTDRRYAMREGLPLSGNGRRESFRFKPICRMTNTMIASGHDDPEEILRSTPRGLFVRKMGGGQVNTVNGDFVFEVNEAYMIKNGKLGDPVRGATLVGNGPKVMNSIDRVGNDLGFGLGTCGKDEQGVPVADAQPTIRIPELTVGGFH